MSARTHRIYACLSPVISAAILHACARPARVEPPQIPSLAHEVALSLPTPLDSLDIHGAAWSPDGQWLAFGATYDKLTNIYVAREDGGDVRRVTDASSSFHVGHWSWLPRDQGLLFVGVRGDSARFYRVDRNGANTIGLPDPPLKGDASDADVSPDGSQVVFATKVDAKHRLLFVRRLDGTNVRALTAPAGPIQFDANPAWSPDGRTILFDSIRDSTGEGALFRINTDGSGTLQLTTNAVNNAIAHWSPDGRHAIWVQIANRRATLVQADPDGSQFRRLAEDVGPGTYSSDGRRIVATGRANDPRHWFIVTLESDGSDLRRLVLRAHGD